MTEYLKAFRPMMSIQCRACREYGHVWCRYWNLSTQYTCRKCGHQWIQNKKSTRGLETYTANGVFYGDWTPDEIKDTQAIVTLFGNTANNVHNWSFFKGKRLYTAWLTTSMPENVHICDNLPALHYQVKAVCSGEL